MVVDDRINVERSMASTGRGGDLGFENTLWEAADKLRGNMDAAEYKHVVLGLIFLKYISDAFTEKRNELLAEDPDYADDRLEYTADRVFWVPEEARWDAIQAAAGETTTIGRRIDDAMDAIERENPSLKGVLPKNYARQDLDKTRLAGVINLIGTITLGDKAGRSKDMLGRVYEYFLARFASAEGKLGGEFYTPSSVVRLLVKMIEPLEGRVFDPCCGSGGMFVQSERFVEAHGGEKTDLSIYGQESNPTTWRLAKMNLAIRGIEADLGARPADSFTRDLHSDLKADYILANPPFNMSDWGGDVLKSDARWQYGSPPARNANYAWIQHFIHHLAPNGVAGFVMSNGSLTSNASGEGDIRRRIVEADLVDCIVALPIQLFYSTQIPVSLWFLTREKENSGFRNRRGETLFIDARNMGTLISRTQRELNDEDIARITGTYHEWRGQPGAGHYEDVPGYCASASIDQIKSQNCVLTPGRYVGSLAQALGELNSEGLKELVDQLEIQFDENLALQSSVRSLLQGLANGR
jgi:type I restriction enzyme M protein